MIGEIAIPTDGQFARDPIFRCDPKIRGTAVCHLNGRCSVCPIAKSYLNPDIPLYVLMQEVRDNK